MSTAPVVLVPTATPTPITRFVGIDVSKATLDVVFLPANRPVQVRKTTAGWSQLLARLGPVHTATTIVLEATGAYHLGLVDA